MSFSDNVIDAVRGSSKTLVLPEGNDERIAEAAVRLRQNELVRKVIVIGADASIDNPGIDVIQADQGPDFEEICDYYSERNSETDQDEVRSKISNPLYYGAGLVALGKVDGMVAGAAHPTADVLRSALALIGTPEGIDLVSSSFIMEVTDERFGEEGVLVFTDPAVVPDPDASEMAQIAGSAVNTYEDLVNGGEPRLGFLSFSTHGSAEHPRVEKVRLAVAEFKDEFPGISADGELQADAALIPEVSDQKSPDSEIEGRANILVFPDLDAANIAYKLVERLGKANAYGPFLQGLNAPVNDLSRGCDVSDIITVSAVTLLRSSEN